MSTLTRYYCWDEHGGKDNAQYIEAETTQDAALKYAELRHTQGLIFVDDYEIIVQSPNRMAEAFRVRMVLEPTFHVERVD